MFDKHIRKTVEQFGTTNIELFLEPAREIESQAEQLARQGYSQTEIEEALRDDIKQLKMKLFAQQKKQQEQAQAIVTEAEKIWQREYNRNANQRLLELKERELQYRFLTADELHETIRQKADEERHDPNDIRLLFQIATEKGLEEIRLTELRERLKNKNFDKPWLQASDKAKQAAKTVTEYKDLKLGDFRYTIKADGKEVTQTVPVDDILNLSGK